MQSANNKSLSTSMVYLVNTCLKKKRNRIFIKSGELKPREHLLYHKIEI